MEATVKFKAVQEAIQTALVAATKSTNRIAAEDLSFQRTINPELEERLNDTTSRLLQLSGQLLESAAMSTEQKVLALTLDDTDDIDANWRRVVDTIDGLLEKADTSLDEYTGLIKRKEAPTSETVSIKCNGELVNFEHAADVNSTQGPQTKKFKPMDQLDVGMRRANILKPQNKFERKPDNFDHGPWKPLLSHKPHAIIPLDRSLGSFVDEYQITQYAYTIYLPLAVHSTRAIEQLHSPNAHNQRASWREQRRRLETLGAV